MRRLLQVSLSAWLLTSCGPHRAIDSASSQVIPPAPQALTEKCSATPWLTNPDGSMASWQVTWNLISDALDLARCDDKRRLGAEAWPK